MLKGSLPIDRSVLIASVVIGSVAIVGVLGSVDAEIISPKVDNITDRLGDYQTPTVYIGDNEVKQKKAKEEFKGLITYNMLSAANCNLVPITTNGLEGGESEITYFKGFDDAVEGLDYEFKNECVPEILPDGGLDFINPFNDIAESSDLEGRQGKVEFNVSQTFTISNPKLIKADYSDDAVGGKGFLFNEQPDFWNGHRVSGFVPKGIRGFNIDFWDRIDESPESPFNDEMPVRFTTGWLDGGRAPIYSALYYYRVRMTGVPTIIDDNSFKQEEDSGSLANFVETARYRFCKGAAGTIQSNAKYMNFGGEAQGDSSKKENAVYPEVRIEEGSRLCLENLIHDSQYNGRDFIDYRIEGNRCKYENLGSNYNSSADVEYRCMLMDDSASLSGYTGQVDYLKTGWKADQSTCETKEYDLTDQEPTTVKAEDGDPSEKITQDLRSYSPPYSFNTTVELSHPEDNSYPGNLYFELPNNLDNRIVNINVENPLVNVEDPLANDKRVVINLLNTGGSIVNRYDDIKIDSDKNTHRFKFEYKSKELRVTHLGTDNYLDVNLKPDQPGRKNLINEPPKQFTMWTKDSGLSESTIEQISDFFDPEDESQEMTINVEETRLEAYPKGCVPEAMN